MQSAHEPHKAAACLQINGLVVGIAVTAVTTQAGLHCAASVVCIGATPLNLVAS